MVKKCYLIIIIILSLASCIGNQNNKPVSTVEPTIQPSVTSETISVTSNVCNSISEQEIADADQDIGLIITGQDNIYIYNFDFSSCYYFPNTSMQNYLSPDGHSIIGLSYKSSENELTIQIKDFINQTIRKSDYQINESEPGRLYDFTISPDLKWVAYKRIDGEIFGIAGEDSNQTKVKIVELESDQPLDPIDVTDRDGAHHAKLIWSPDGRYLAYPDFDNNGVTQIYFYDPIIKQKTRITNFTDSERDYGIGRIIWSLDSSKIIFTKGKFSKVDSYLYYYDSTERLAVFDIPSEEIEWIDSEDRGIRNIWVGNDNNVLLYLEGNTTIEPLIMIYNIDHMESASTINPQIDNEPPDYGFIIPGDGDFDNLLIGGNGVVSYNNKDDRYTFIDSYPFGVFFRVILTPSGLLPNIK